jgi:hypothetical protein
MIENLLFRSTRARASPTFHVGYCVRVAENRKSGALKLQVNWKVPLRIASVESDYVSVVKNMLKKELKTACATRLRFFQDKELNVTTELVQVAEHNDHP